MRSSEIGLAMEKEKEPTICPEVPQALQTYVQENLLSPEIQPSQTNNSVQSISHVCHSLTFGVFASVVAAEERELHAAVIASLERLYVMDVNEPNDAQILQALSELLFFFRLILRCLATVQHWNVICSNFMSFLFHITNLNNSCFPKKKTNLN